MPNKNCRIGKKAKKENKNIMLQTGETGVFGV